MNQFHIKTFSEDKTKASSWRTHWKYPSKRNFQVHFKYKRTETNLTILQPDFELLRSCPPGALRSFWPPSVHYHHPALWSPSATRTSNHWWPWIWGNKQGLVMNHSSLYFTLFWRKKCFFHQNVITCASPEMTLTNVINPYPPTTCHIKTEIYHPTICQWIKIKHHQHFLPLYILLHSQKT